jgi:hypothetical protein
MKLRLLAECVDHVRQGFTILPLAGYVDRLGALDRVAPRFFHDRNPGPAAAYTACGGGKL